MQETKFTFFFSCSKEIFTPVVLKPIDFAASLIPSIIQNIFAGIVKSVIIDYCRFYFYL